MKELLRVYFKHFQAKFLLVPQVFCNQRQKEKARKESKLVGKLNFGISTRDFEGKKMCFYKNEQVAVSIKTPLGEDHDKVIEKKQDGRCDVHFTPNFPVPHHVIITVNSQPLTGSPRSIHVSPH